MWSVGSGRPGVIFHDQESQSVYQAAWRYGSPGQIEVLHKTLDYSTSSNYAVFRKILHPTR